MEQRERTVRLWFDMWLRGEGLGIQRIFAPDCVYTESWGPRYEGREKIAHWFREWNGRGRVVRWDIRQFFHRGDQTVAEWYFQDTMDDGRVLTQQADYPYGDFNNPFSWEFEHQKFHSLADGVLTPERADTLAERIARLEELEDVNLLFQGLSSAPAHPTPRSGRLDYVTNGALRYE